MDATQKTAFNRLKTLGTFPSLFLLTLLLLGVLFFHPFQRRPAIAPTSLTVALYPYVSDLNRFKAIIADEWARVEPGIPIQWRDWDGGYHADPSADFDVYVFDGLMLDHYKERHWLLPLSKKQIPDFDDFVSYAADGVTQNEEIYGIPQMGCGYFLFYRKGDRALAQANTLDELHATLGDCTYSDTFPTTNKGLLVISRATFFPPRSIWKTSNARLRAFPSPLQTWMLAH